MKIQLLLLVAGVVCFTAGCATTSAGPKEPGKPMRSQEVEGFNSADFTPPNPNDVHIYVDGGLIVIDQEPVRRKAIVAHVIQWRLDKNQPYSFPDNKAIAISGSIADLNCGTIGDKKQVFVCSYTRTGPALWKYSVRIKNNQTGSELPPLDPTIHQE